MNAAKVSLFVFFALWPFTANLAFKYGLMQVFLVLSALLLAGRAILLLVISGVHARKETLATSLPGILLILSALLIQDNWAFYYPVLVSITLLATFLLSLKTKPIIQRFSEISIKNQEVSPEIVSYTRKVTILWCFFFALNGAVALYTVWLGDLDVWTLYNGCLSYVAVGALFCGEYFYRKVILHV